MKEMKEPNLSDGTLRNPFRTPDWSKKTGTREDQMFRRTNYLLRDWKILVNKIAEISQNPTVVSSLKDLSCARRRKTGLKNALQVQIHCNNIRDYLGGIIMNFAEYYPELLLRFDELSDRRIRITSSKKKNIYLSVDPHNGLYPE